MKKQALFIFITILLFGLFYYSAKEFFFYDEDHKSLKVLVEFESSNSDLFQLFYRDSLTKNFSEKFSERIAFEESEEVQTIIFTIPDSLNVDFFRLDIGNNKHISPVVISKINFTYNGNSFSIPENKITNYFTPNRFIEFKENKYYRKIIDKRSDPIFVSTKMSKELEYLKKQTNISRLFLIITVSLSIALSVSLSLWFSYYSPKKNVIFITLFFVVICLPHLDEYVSLDDTNISEKRVLLEKPEFILKSIEDYPKSFETYYSDTFGFRKKMVSLNAIVKVKFFNTSPKKDKVFVGKNDWLFYWDKGIKQSYLNSSPFLKSDLGRYGNKIININEEAKNNNSLFISTIFPNKHTIYDEFIPSRIKSLKTKNESRINQYYSFLKKNKIIHTDNRKVLLFEKAKHKLYLKNDSHWNSFGAYYTYKNIIDELFKLDSLVGAPLELEKFKVSRITDYKKGDLLNLMGIDNRNSIFKDEYFRFINSNDKFNRVLNRYGENSIIVENENSENNYVVLFFGDSYSYELVQFLPNHFKKTIFVRDIAISKVLINKINPDIIIYGIVERNLENF